MRPTPPGTAPGGGSANWNGADCDEEDGSTAGIDSPAGDNSVGGDSGGGSPPYPPLGWKGWTAPPLGGLPLRLGFLFLTGCCPG